MAGHFFIFILGITHEHAVGPSVEDGESQLDF
jgi:hypothetical protein